MTKSKSVGGMGFRDLALFNDSLLAKQAWRLLQNKNSLFYRVFKAKFFPNCLIMEEKHSRSGSHAWTSILHGRDVLKRGCRWRIGDGKSVGIWQDFWLPRQSTPQVLSPPLEFLSEARVEILIEESERKWNHGLIDGIFTEEEAKLIKSLPLSQTAPEDSIFWPHTNNRVYTSKSRYKVLKQEASTEAAITHTLKLEKICGTAFGPYKSQIKLNIFHGEQPESHYQQNKTCSAEPSLIAPYVIDANLNQRLLYMRHGHARNCKLFGRMLVLGVSEGQEAF